MSAPQIFSGKGKIIENSACRRKDVKQKKQHISKVRAEYFGAEYRKKNTVTNPLGNELKGRVKNISHPPRSHFPKLHSIFSKIHVDYLRKVEKVRQQSRTLPFGKQVFALSQKFRMQPHTFG